MLSKRDLLEWLIADVGVSDDELCAQDHILRPSVCLPTDREHVQRLARILGRLWQSFDYLRSPEFQSAVAGRGATFGRDKEEAELTPQRTKRHRSRLRRALGGILDSDEAYRRPDTDI